MLKTFDLILIGIMIAAATVTYTIKHGAELKLTQIHHLEAEIKLEKDTIELLKADWALVVQPNRLERLVNVYNDELKLQPTVSTALALPNELPMLRSQLPQPSATVDAQDGSTAKSKPGTLAQKSGDATDDEIRQVIADVASKPAPKPIARASGKRPGVQTDKITTGSVKR